MNAFVLVHIRICGIMCMYYNCSVCEGEVGIGNLYCSLPYSSRHHFSIRSEAPQLPRLVVSEHPRILRPPGVGITETYYCLWVLGSELRFSG